MGWEFILVPELGNMWLAWWLSLRETAFLLQKSFRTFAFRCVGLYQKDLSEGPTDAAFTNHPVCRPGGRHVWWDARLKIVYFKHSWPGGHWWGGLVWLSILRWKEESALLNKVRYLVDPASSHMLVSKIKPCMSKYKHLYCETANGSLNQLSFIWWSLATWIPVVILELIHATTPDFWKGGIY